jgi:aminomethyltransferase
VQYAEGVRAEHLWTREHAGLFDVSHMGQLRIRGPALEKALERALPVDFEGWQAGLQRYSLLLNDRGGIEDDLMLTRLEDEVAMVVNASTKDADRARLASLCPSLDFAVVDSALLALQGPRAEAVLAQLDPAAASLRFMHAARLRLDATECFVTRSGYTGEDGYEISVPAERAEALAKRLLDHGEVKPIGLGARDTLRLEAALHLYGQDMDAGTTPYEAALEWAIAKSRRAGGAKAGGYPGAQELLEQERSGAGRRLGGFVGHGKVPVRHGAPIVDGAGTELGSVTSGTVSPTLNKPVMLGYVKTPHEAETLFAMVRGERQPIGRAALPFVPKRYKR